jgi:hypothetical protein
MKMYSPEMLETRLTNFKKKCYDQMRRYASTSFIGRMTATSWQAWQVPQGQEVPPLLEDIRWFDNDASKQ